MKLIETQQIFFEQFAQRARNADVSLQLHSRDEYRLAARYQTLSGRTYFVDAVARGRCMTSKWQNEVKQNIVITIIG